MPQTEPPVRRTPAGTAGAPAADRRRLGAFYTPPAVAEHMVGLLTGLGPHSRLLEPSGGDGVFVNALLADGRVCAAQVQVWDIDPATEPVLTGLGVGFTCRDALLGTPHPSAFTHVVGNPPYLNKHSDYLRTHRDQLRRRYAAVGLSDTYAMFIAMALEQLAPGGQLVFLVSDTFLTLGIHRRLRELLLTTCRIDAITLLPDGTFADAAVSTAIVNLARCPAPAGHRVELRDLRGAPVGEFDAGTVARVPQTELARTPGSVFVFEPAARAALRVAAACPPLTGVLDGGLGMYTRDNGRFLGVVDRAGHTAVRPRPGQPVVPEADLDGVRWRPYHKRGGATRWWAPAEHCLRWDEQSRAAYVIPTSARPGLEAAASRSGFVISGVATRLTARAMTAGALWESNKAFGFFPADPDTYPAGFFLAVLNSTWYAELAAALNHTVSLQMRDVAALPLLPHTPGEVAELAGLGDRAVALVRAGGGVPAAVTGRIDALVAVAVARAAADLPPVA